METIRSGKQTNFSGTIKPLAIKTIVKRTLLMADILVVTNTGKVPFVIYLSDKKGEAVTGKAKTLQPNEVFKIAAQELGDPATMPYITISNNDADNKASFELELS